VNPDNTLRIRVENCGTQGNPEPSKRARSDFRGVPRSQYFLLDSSKPSNGECNACLRMLPIADTARWLAQWSLIRRQSSFRSRICGKSVLVDAGEIEWIQNGGHGHSRRFRRRACLQNPQMLDSRLARAERSQETTVSPTANSETPSPTASTTQHPLISGYVHQSPAYFR
jgi:hypothetical protein